MASSDLIGIFTGAELDTAIAAYKAAFLAVSTGGEYEISSGGSSQRLTRTNLQAIKDTLKELQAAKDALTSGGPITHTLTSFQP